ncbi:uncharacterized protein TNCV_3319571 [Trichonephila clavipes]|nr:uncharacterized protein TNCV_3319571 [Trichonephila clavipes]
MHVPFMEYRRGKKRPSSKVVSDIDCGAVGRRLESRRRHGCLQMYNAFVAGGTLKSCETACPLVRLVEGGERWKAPDYSQGVLPLNWGVNEQNRTVTCRVLKTKANDRHKILALRCDEFRGP